MFVRLHKKTIAHFEELSNKLGDIDRRQMYRRMYYGYEEEMVDLDELREWIFMLENMAARNQNDGTQVDSMISESEDDWLVCEEDIEIIPIYKEAISLSALRAIVKPAEIHYLLRYIKIPSTKNGAEIENHNFGYHFHYGKVKSGRLIRSDLLLTFNSNSKQDDQSENDYPTLYSESHGEGHSIHLDVETIGLNKRRPIYSVCCDEAKKRGFANFKLSRKDSKVFYP